MATGFARQENKYEHQKPKGMPKGGGLCPSVCPQITQQSGLMTYREVDLR